MENKDTKHILPSQANDGSVDSRDEDDVCDLEEKFVMMSKAAGGGEFHFIQHDLCHAPGEESNLEACMSSMLPVQETVNPERCVALCDSSASCSGAPDSDILRSLECPVCSEAMSAPIELCSGGHSLCGACRLKIAECPVCRSPLSGTRNYLAEQLAERLLGSCCENAGRGCPVRLQPGRQLNRHHLRCEFRPYKCLFCRESPPPRGLEAHVQSLHGVAAAGCGRASGILHRISLAMGAFRGGLLRAFDELFWFWWYATEGRVYLGVDACGKCDGSYMYSLEMRSYDGRRRMAFDGPVHSALEHRPMQHLEPCAVCAVVTTKFVGDGVKYSIRISLDF